MTGGPPAPGPIHELRIALTVDDIDTALHFYHHALGLPVVQQWSTPEGRGYILAFGSTTLELIDRAQAELIDHIEVGQRVAGPVRLAFEVQDIEEVHQRLREAGARSLADPVHTPWGHDNARLQAPDGMQITLYRVPKDGDDKK
ncbi:MAG: VOC family protein [Chloroflexota bacterium]|nr:VOC family protein [Chloroflexota bacterium]